MSRKVNPEFDKKVLFFLETHTWIETQNEFQVSSRTIKNIKDRNSHKIKKNNKVDYQKVAKQFLSMFIDLQSQKVKNSHISIDKWNTTIQKHLDFNLINSAKENLKL